MSKLIGESHGIEGSSGDFELDDGTQIRISCTFGLLCSQKTEVFSLPDLVLMSRVPDWTFAENLARSLGCEFPLRHKKYLGLEFRRERGWLDDKET